MALTPQLAKIQPRFSGAVLVFPNCLLTVLLLGDVVMVFALIAQHNGESRTTMSVRHAEPKFQRILSFSPLTRRIKTSWSFKRQKRRGKKLYWGSPTRGRNIARISRLPRQKKVAIFLIVVLMKVVASSALLFFLLCLLLKVSVYQKQKKQRRRKCLSTPKRWLTR